MKYFARASRFSSPADCSSESNGTSCRLSQQTLIPWISGSQTLPWTNERMDDKDVLRESCLLLTSSLASLTAILTALSQMLARTDRAKVDVCVFFLFLNYSLKSKNDTAPLVKKIIQFQYIQMNYWVPPFVWCRNISFFLCFIGL